MAALQFLRTRHGVGDGSDLGRISNQQVFLSSLVRTIKSADTLANPVKLYALAKAAVSNMQLSDSLNNLDRMVQIGLALKDIDLDKVVFIQYPTGVSDGGVKPITEAADALVAALKADQPVVLSGGTGPGDIGSVVQTPTPGAPRAPPRRLRRRRPRPATDGATVLPDAATGQTAAQMTCSKGRTLNNQ